MFLLLAVTRPALADTWTPVRPDDPSRFSLVSIEFRGEFDGKGVGDLKDVIHSSTSGLLRFRPVNFDRLTGDEQRVRNHFRHLGFWNVVVELELEFDHEQRRTRAVFNITTGLRRVLGEIRVVGQQAFSAEEVGSWITQETGDPFDVSATDRDRRSIEDNYANRGFFQIEVVADIQPTPADTDPRVHDLVYRVAEGPRIFVGSISVEGNELTKESIIRRELTLRPGEVLNRELVSESRARLYATGFFSRVEIRPDIDAAIGHEVDVVIRVTERTVRFVGLGVGYGTRDQLRLSGEWGHRNLWGRGKRATVRGILATELFPADLVRTRVEGRYVEPWLFGTRTVGSTELSYERSLEFTTVRGQEFEYDLDLVTLLVNVNRQLTRHTRGFLTLQNEWADQDSDEEVELPAALQPDVTRTVVLTVDRDRRNNYFDPSRGFRNSLIASVSGGILGGDNDFWKIQTESDWFRTLRGLTLAGRVRLGYERTFSDSETVPDYQRFKLGGPNTVRGYDFQEIGPGDFLILGNVEVRFPLFWILGAGIFLDGGNAWETFGDVRWKDFDPRNAKDDPDRAGETEFRYSSGAGLRLATPVGPVRFDAARKLKLLPPGDDGVTESRWGYEISLGHVF